MQYIRYMRYMPTPYMSEERLKLLKKNVVAIFFDILKNMRFTGVAVAQR